ncbi:MAG: DUF1700 domain-containing protein [Lachnospiraceae bacterium]|nr:DUF1700 domain-containing protein [Lachnospiraceae bacterium]
MLRDEYINQLRIRLNENDIPGADGMVEFYEEMIADRMEDGMSEEEAVAAMEDIDHVVAQARLDRPLPALMLDKVKESHEKANKSSKGALWIALAIIGFPVWFPLTIAFLAIVFSLYVSLWAIVISVYAVELAFGISAVACFFGGFAFIFGHIPFATSLALWGCALVFAGLCILLWKPILAATAGMIGMIKWLFRKIKSIFV